MIIDSVTITGADDRTDIQAMLEVSGRYPMVEWGILLSKSRACSRRYPSRQWVDDFIEAVMDGRDRVNVSFHLCGGYVDMFLEDERSEEVARLLRCCSRVQLNVDFKAKGITGDDLRHAVMSSPVPVITQHNANNNWPWANPKHHVLFDSSRGEGKLGTWQAPLRDEAGNAIYCGYAGGLNPCNIRDELDKICKLTTGQHAWLDVETGVRTGDELSFNKVRSILDAVEEHNRRHC